MKFVGLALAGVLSDLLNRIAKLFELSPKYMSLHDSFHSFIVN